MLGLYIFSSHTYIKSHACTCLFCVYMVPLKPYSESTGFRKNIKCERVVLFYWLFIWLFIRY